MIFISIAHSSKSPGAENKQFGITEYEVSKKASYACFELLSNQGLACSVLDCGAINDHDYSIYKPDFINRVVPKTDLAIEIHCNSCDSPEPHCGEVLYRSSTYSYISKMAAEAICQSMSDGFTKSINPLKYINNGAIDASSRKLFFLEKTIVPALIIEGLFISNPEHAKWLKNGGSEAYGTLVANGILNFLNKSE